MKNPATPLLCAAALLLCVPFALNAQAPGSGYAQQGPPVVPADDKPMNDLPNPYTTVSDFFKGPEGWIWGAVGGTAVDAKGNIWAVQRCEGETCIDAKEDPIVEFDKTGKFLKSFGGGLFSTPHSITIDAQGNIWITDFQAKAGKGMQVWKFDPTGKVLLTLGKAGEAASGADGFNMPSSVAIAPNGDIFVADGHGTPGSNYRIAKFDKTGKFLKEWGKKGSGPGEFGSLHTLAFDMKGRLLVGDKGNNRIQIFDQDGTYLTEWRQFSRPGGIFVDKQNNIYVADSDSNVKNHPNWARGIRVGSATDGSVKYFIPDPHSDPTFGNTSGAEFVSVDSDGILYAAEVREKDIKKYVKK